MSKELLQRVGEFLHGEQWQAPLSHNIGVGERSMRRWVAGTDQIPRGIWREIGFRLESVQGDLEYLFGEVQRANGLIEVHSFKAWDHRNGGMVDLPVKSTAERISRVGGTIIPRTSEWLPPTSVDADGRVREEAEGRKGGFQTQVTR